MPYYGRGFKKNTVFLYFFPHLLVQNRIPVHPSTSQRDKQTGPVSTRVRQECSSKPMFPPPVCTLFQPTGAHSDDRPMLFRKSQRVKNKPGGGKIFRAAEFIFRATFFGGESLQDVRIITVEIIKMITVECLQQ